jgi:hypothetical protein
MFPNRDYGLIEIVASLISAKTNTCMLVELRSITAVYSRSVPIAIGRHNNDDVINKSLCDVFTKAYAITFVC